MSGAYEWPRIGREGLADHPEWVLLPLSAAAWLLLIVPSWAGEAHLCGGPAVGLVGGVADRLQAAWQTGTFGRLLLGWVVMTIAMMLPLTAPMLRHVAGRSFAVRRPRAVAEFVAGHLAVWVPLGAVFELIIAAVPASLIGSAMAAAAGFLVAAAWQCAGRKRAALLRCHRTVPLSPWGWRADWDCVSFGVAHGKDCAVSCWAMMLACMFSHGVIALLCVQALMLNERRSRVPAPRRSAAALAGCGALALALPLVGLSRL